TVQVQTPPSHCPMLHVVPSPAFPVIVQTGAPLAHEMAAVWHSPAAQASPWPPQQLDAAHTCEPLQLFVHCPQWLKLDVVSLSQPSSVAGAAGWVQLPELGLQFDVHRPAAQASAFVLALPHGRVHAPQ